MRQHALPPLAALVAVALSSSAANAATTPVVMNRYVLTVPVGPETEPIDNTVLSSFCQDEDGCEVILWADVLESTGAAKRTRLMVSGGGQWQTTDGMKGIDDNGGAGEETALANSGWCLLKDGIGGADFSAGFYLENILGATCTLVLID